jgi:hypothetical protein
MLGIVLSAMLLIPSVKFVILLLSTLIILAFVIVLSAYFAPVIKLSGYHNKLLSNILVIFEKSTSLILLFVIPPANLLFVIELSGILLTLNIKLIILLQSTLIILLLLILFSAYLEPVRKLSTK